MLALGGVNPELFGSFNPSYKYDNLNEKSFTTSPLRINQQKATPHLEEIGGEFWMQATPGKPTRPTSHYLILRNKG